MERTTRYISVLFAAVCAAALMIPGLAFAADTNSGISQADAYDQTITWDTVEGSGDTEYWLQLEEGDLDRISVDVPVRVVLAVDTDGTFVTPTAKNNVIENNSEFPIYVSNMAIDTKTGFVLEEATGFEALTTNNIYRGAISSVTLNAAGTDVENTLQSVAFTQMGTYAGNNAWAMEHSDAAARSGDDCLFIQIGGAIANVSGHYFTAPINVFDVTYTFAATPATAVNNTATTSLTAPAGNITD